MGKREFALMVMFAGILVLGNLQEASAQCGGNFSAVFAQCEQFYRENGPTEPSLECCQELKRQNIDLQCACDYIASRPPGIGPRNGIDLNRTVSVSRACGIQIPPGLRCGDFIIPPNPAPYPAPPPEEGS
ncbi:hypothetical protein LR48_Vigan07g026200 [Vigna angularis]|uniref:Bifunctional inhibitor/plant lipid transfer protein/seed storage helical domain-containing protein n=2 Tax=Phaseolus angularis TaxID=3914 RepID=A0A0L9UUY2_PHAAN|nr:non-specific lipid transfer protein GPI-anchored 26 [Vigna angularis]KAG2390805.1 uncharacterized protein HKW66_Vig0134340 [Vigna angularis]KOM46558.1 hypothetical protein LR48_Vigan07g026200 [Vigna angularis]BAT80667.1 hypothetical protein VIGAN_03026300 [Vigna angularis var. angularis]